MSANIFERNGRAAKCSALIAALELKLGPFTRAQCVTLADGLSKFSRRQWAELARDAGCNPPTFRKGVSITAQEVIAHFIDRAAGRASTEPTLPAFEDPRGDVDLELQILEELAQQERQRAS